MSKTARLHLPMIAQSQAQKHITHNEALFVLDMVAQASVLDAGLSVPPSGPKEGDCYLVAAGASGDWTGKENHIAAWRGSDWIFATPQAGWRVWDLDSQTLLIYGDGNWQSDKHIPNAIQQRGQIGILTNADNINRLSVKSDAILFSHDDVSPGSGDIRAKVNKQAEDKTASFLFQTNWAGAAEIGLMGDNHFSFKVSDNGSDWHTALRLNKISARAEFPKGCSMEAPVKLAPYNRASLPDASDWSGSLAFISDAPSGPKPAYSDGAIWRYIHDSTAVV
ncbi:MAG: DUF2793 domain-containing protein [Cohaesibacter sp.]|jgi:hypothetical protein|nr:DUF2793 domain-containing protein [Cohaesibacter sp.]